MTESDQILKSKIGFWIWMVSFVLLTVITSVLVTAMLVRHVLLGGERLSKSQQAIVVSVAEFPSLIQQTMKEFLGGGQQSPLLKNKKDIEKKSWSRQFPLPADNGFLLFSGVTPGKLESVVQLIKIADGRVMAEWRPDWGAVNNKITTKKYGAKGSSNVLHAVHPLLLDNGDLVFNTPMARSNSPTLGHPKFPQAGPVRL